MAENSVNTKFLKEIGAIKGKGRKLQDRIAKMAQSYDHNKQVWILDGKYQPCSHPESLGCSCYGRIHAYKRAKITESCR